MLLISCVCIIVASEPYFAAAVIRASHINKCERIVSGKACSKSSAVQTPSKEFWITVWTKSVCTVSIKHLESLTALSSVSTGHTEGDAVVTPCWAVDANGVAVTFK